MTPVNKLKYAILDLAEIWNGNDERLQTDLTDEQVEELWDETDVGDAMNEIRTGGVSTGLPSPSSRHYETEAVATQCPNGEWVGYTYWYGGGKHSNPEEVEWIDYAYDVSCVEEEKMVLVQTFKKADQ